MELDNVQKKIWQHVESELATERVASVDHVRRMVTWCQQLGADQGADLESLLAGALVHDIGVVTNRKNHFITGKKKAAEIMREAGLTENKIKEALHVLETHSRYGGPEPETIEAEIGQDADALEYIGAIGILRAIVRGLTDGSFDGRIDKFPDYLRGLLSKVEGTFHTDMAREIGTRRIKYMYRFLEHIEKELKGEV